MKKYCFVKFLRKYNETILFPSDNLSR